MQSGRKSVRWRRWLRPVRVVGYYSDRVGTNSVLVVSVPVQDSVGVGLRALTGHLVKVWRCIRILTELIAAAATVYFERDRACASRPVASILRCRLEVCISDGLVGAAVDWCSHGSQGY